jgi:putative spermidine/putrescine transport system substrate-binding protein
MVAGMVGFAGGMPGDAAPSNELTVTAAGGTFEQWVRTKLIAPFEKATGARVTVVTGLTMTNLAKLRASRGRPQIDVVTMDPPGAVPAAREDLLEKLDPNRIPNLKNVLPWTKFKYDTLAPDFFTPICLAYNTAQVTSAPASWTDLWKADYKGKVLIPDIGQSYAFFFLMMVSKTYTGRDYYDTDVIFSRLATLKPNVLTYWTSHDQVAQLLNSAQAWIVPWGTERAMTQNKQGAPINCVTPREGSVVNISTIAIARGTPHLELAERFVNMWLSAEVQSSQAEDIFHGIVVKGVSPGPTAKQYLTPPPGRNWSTPDWDQLLSVQSTWTDRWNREMVK